MSEKVQKRGHPQSSMRPVQKGYTNGKRIFKLLTPNACEIHFTAETHELAAVAVIALGWGSFGLQKVSNSAVIVSPGMNRQISSTKWFKDTFGTDLRAFALRNADKIIKALRSAKTINDQKSSKDILKIINTAADLIESKYI